MSGTKERIFLSSVQKEFSDERKLIKESIEQDAYLGNYYEVFLFEDVPSTSQKPEEVYIDEVKKSKIYIGLFGAEYGKKNAAGISATELELKCAIKEDIPTLIFVDASKKKRDKEVGKLIKKMDSKVVRNKFNNQKELIEKVKQSLVKNLMNNLMNKGILREHPSVLEDFSKTLKLRDIDGNAVKRFTELMKSDKMLYQSTKDIPIILKKLGLLKDGKIKYTASFAFGKNPQEDLMISKVRCVLVAGYGKTGDIINDKFFEGNAFELIDDATKFITDNIRERILRKGRIRHKKELEVPIDVYREAIINAVTHRDYLKNSNVEIVIYDDRVCITNPALSGYLPSPQEIEENTVESILLNPSLAEIFSRAGYIEKFGSGIVGMINECLAEGIQRPEFYYNKGFVKAILWKKEYPPSTPPVPPQYPPSTLQVRKLLAVIKGEMSREEFQQKLCISNKKYFLQKYMSPALKEGFIEMTIPDAPNSKNQKYRLTEKGKDFLEELLRDTEA